jgi:hypothetical protein
MMATAIPPYLKYKSKNFKDFFYWSVNYLAKHDKKVIISNTRYVKINGDVACSGWCDGYEMVVAAKNPLFERVYVHEFSHMNQAVEKCPHWDESDNTLWEHLAQKKVQIRSWDAILNTITLERDCERRSINHAKQWDLFDVERYAQNANVYLYYYHYIFLKQAWANHKNIYHPVLMREMPTKLLPLSNFKSINMDMMKLFEECLDRKGRYYRKEV